MAYYFHQYLVLLVFLIIAILMGVKLYPIVILILLMAINVKNVHVFSVH